MSKPSAPAAPDPTTEIAAQSTANQQSALQTAELNRVNQNTPYGSLSYTQDGTNPDGTPQYTQTESLSPSEQNLFNLSQQGAQSLGTSAVGLLGQVQNSTQPLNYAGAPGLSSSASSNIPLATGVSQFGGSTNAAMQQAENAAYQGQTQYLNPQFAQAQEALTNNLANQGVTQGSQAANTAQQNLGLQENQAYGNAGLQAVQAGQQEQNTLFSQGLSNAGLQNSAQSQQFGQNLQNSELQNQTDAQYLSQMYAQQAQPLNEYNALMTGSQVQQPNFSSYAQSPVAATQSASIMNQGYQNQLSQYQTQMSGINNLFSLGGSLGSAAILS